MLFSIGRILRPADYAALFSRPTSINGPFRSTPGYAVAFGMLFVVGSFRLPLDRSDKASMILTGIVPIVFGIVIFAKPGAGALAVLALIAAFALVTGISELVVAIGGEKLFERTAKAFAPPRRSLKTTPEPSH